MRQQDALIQVTLAAGPEVAAPPSTASIQAAQGQLVTARLVSRLPQVDPRLQSPSFVYVARSNPNLVPGMSLTFLIPSGGPIQGVVIPRDAVVWWNGRAWVYVQIGAEQFARREVSTAMPVSNGWFAKEGFSQGEKVVVTGVQQLLSEEFRSSRFTGPGFKQDLQTCDTIGRLTSSTLRSARLI